MQQPGAQQQFHERLNTADRHQLRHEVAATGLQVCEHRYPPSDAREVIELEPHARLMRNGQQMQHRIGRATERDHHGDGVLERAAREDPARLQSERLSSPTASCAELPGKDKPKASIAEAMVLAVYMPAQLPGPGMAVRSISSSPASESLPAACAPTASNTEIMSRRCAPGRIVPP